MLSRERMPLAPMEEQAEKTVIQLLILAIKGSPHTGFWVTKYSTTILLATNAINQRYDAAAKSLKVISFSVKKMCS